MSDSDDSTGIIFIELDICDIALYAKMHAGDVTDNDHFFYISGEEFVEYWFKQNKHFAYVVMRIEDCMLDRPVATVDNPPGAALIGCY